MTLLYRMLTGRLPWPAGNTAQATSQFTVVVTPASLAALRLPLSTSLSITEALSTPPAARPETQVGDPLVRTA